MSGKYLTVRMLKLPAEIRGPRTRWRIALHFYGKNSGKASLLATCLTHGHTVVFEDGRANVTEGTARCGFSVQIGTLKCRIMSAAVAQGVAEFVDTTAGG